MKQIKLLIPDRLWWELGQLAEKRGKSIPALLEQHVIDAARLKLGLPLDHVPDRVTELHRLGLDDGQIGQMLGQPRGSVAAQRRRLGLKPNKASQTRGFSDERKK